MRTSASAPAPAATCASRPGFVTTPSRRPLGQRRGDADDTARIVRAAADGDAQAWSTLIDRHSKLLRAIARMYRLNSSDAEDVVQTTWLRLVEQLPRIRTPEHVRSWLATTAERECLRILRQAARCRPADELPEPRLQPETAEIDARLLQAERDEALRQAIRRLPNRDQTLLGLLLADPPLSYEAIAIAMDRPTGSIGPTRTRCLSRLRRETRRVGLAA